MKPFREIVVKCNQLEEQALAEICLILLEEEGLSSTVEVLTILLQCHECANRIAMSA